MQVPPKKEINERCDDDDDVIKAFLSATLWPCFSPHERARDTDDRKIAKEVPSGRAWPTRLYAHGRHCSGQVHPVTVIKWLQRPS